MGDDLLVVSHNRLIYHSYRNHFFLSDLPKRRDGSVGKRFYIFQVCSIYRVTERGLSLVYGSVEFCRYTGGVFAGWMDT
jgi:hypothetical protein